MQVSWVFVRKYSTFYICWRIASIRGCSCIFCSIISDYETSHHKDILHLFNFINRIDGGIFSHSLWSKSEFLTMDLMVAVVACGIWSKHCKVDLCRNHRHNPTFSCWYVSAPFKSPKTDLRKTPVGFSFVMFLPIGLDLNYFDHVSLSSSVLKISCVADNETISDSSLN